VEGYEELEGIGMEEGGTLMSDTNATGGRNQRVQGSEEEERDYRYGQMSKRVI